MISPFTANITKTSASSFSITVMDHSTSSKKTPTTITPTRIVVDKTFKKWLNNILDDRKSFYELTHLCHIWENAYTAFLNLDYDNCDGEIMLETYASWYKSAIRAVYFSYTIKYHKTACPPCPTCGHHVSHLCVESEFVDHGEYLADATISVQCGKCRMNQTYLKLK